ncbi:MAG: serine/threonine protein kinase [Myxococcales bacterium]|nr:serine/threonine protein kinase [Myxococcales bacterium]
MTHERPVQQSPPPRGPTPGPPPAPPPAARAPRVRPRPMLRAIDWSSGRPLNGRYRMLQKLGEGGMGAVWLCEDLLLRRKVALKTLFSDRTVTEEDLERFRREVAIAHAVNHPNVARTYDLGEALGTHYLTMEFLEGRTLVDRLRDGPALTAREVRDLAAPLCNGLRAAHRAGIVHRDLKPANVMLVPDERKCVVMDFGIARATGTEDSASENFGPVTNFEVTSAGRGTPTYMAPEQWEGEGGDARTDVYALGVILFVCLTRRAPFRADSADGLADMHRSQPAPSVLEFAPKTDRDLAELVRRCLQKEPSRRPQDMGEVLDRLQRGQRRAQYGLHVALTVVASAVLFTVVGLGLWTVAKRAIVCEMRPAVARLAEVVALQLDARDLDQVRGIQDIDTVPFRTVQTVLQRYRVQNPDVSALYTMKPSGKTNEYVFVVDAEPRDRDENGNGQIDDAERGTPPGLTYDGTDSPGMAEVKTHEGPTADLDFATDAWGISLSGYASVAGRDGKRTDYFVGADAHNRQLERLKIELLTLFGLAWLVVSVGFAIVRWMVGQRRKGTT